MLIKTFNGSDSYLRCFLFYLLRAEYIVWYAELGVKVRNVYWLIFYIQYVVALRPFSMVQVA